MTRVLAMLSAAAGLAASARAQSTLDSTVTFSLSWTESDANGLPAGNGNGILEPGEHALIHLAVSFTNQNTVGTYSPFPPGPGSGTIRGFGWGFIDLNGMNNAPGTWNLDHDGFGLGTQDPWSGTVEAHSGTPINGGAGVMDMQMGQLPLSNAAIMDANPISPVWLGVWTPASFDARGVIFACAKPACPPAVVAASGDGARGRVKQLVAPNGFGQNQFHARLAHAGEVPLPAQRASKNDLERAQGLVGLDACSEFQAVLLRHHHVHDGRVERRLCLRCLHKQRPRVGGVGGQNDDCAAAGQVARHDLTVGFAIIDHEDARLFQHAQVEVIAQGARGACIEIQFEIDPRTLAQFAVEIDGPAHQRNEMA